MKVAVIYFQNEGSSFSEIASSLSKGLESQDCRVTLVDGNRETVSLTSYKYIAIGIEAQSAFSLKMPRALTDFLSNSGLISGKRSYAFTKKSLRSERRLSILMQHMEREGMILKRSDILTSANSAKEIGKKLKVKSH